ncbi:uncharacterized protein V6R79_007383 [Siganus canaliculatus]
MNWAHKRRRLSSAVARSDLTPPPPGSSPQTVSHDALLLPPPAAPAGGGEEEEEEEEEGGYLLVEEDTTDSSLIITMDDSQVNSKTARRRATRKKNRKLIQEVGGASESEEDLEIDRQLDQSLETKSRQHNLTTVNVRNIIHEVITNEHVVAMMKAAINDTEAVPPFEPKMTRSKFKEVVEKGVVIPAWNISPIKKTSDVVRGPQFMDIPLAEEDSSDEEYRPDEEDEDETAEDTFLESDMESTASSPRGTRLSRQEEDSCSPWQVSRSRPRCRRAGSTSMGPPPPPKAPPPKAVTDSAFLEKLHAVEEELAVCIKPYQPLAEDDVGLMAYRTRSKRPLRNVPLGQLEAELRAPDITPDMYDSAHEDRDWTDWLRGLMTSDMDNEEECDDEDDPEYNFLADTDEPDLEDYRDDKAVRITKKEVNELMEELFETLKEDLVGQEVEDEGHEEEEEPQPVQTHTAEEQLDTPADDQEEDGPIRALRTVKQQLDFLRKRRHTPAHCNTHSAEEHTLRLDAQQRRTLTQHLQQHVQLLTQVHLLCSPVARLQSEAETSRQFLVELDVLAQRSELLMSSARPSFLSVFRASNLQGALQLLDELHQSPISYRPPQPPPDARGHIRCFPLMPAGLAWIFATRPVFLYPELLPSVGLDPALYCPRRTAAFTAAEDCLLVLGLRNMEGSSDPTKLVAHFLLRKTLVQVRRRILQCCRPGVPDNIVKVFRYQQVLWPMLVACRHVDPAERRPPLERDERLLPVWLARSLPVLYRTITHYNSPEAPPPCWPGPAHRSHLTSFPPGTRFPPRLPENLDLRRIGFVLLQQPLPLPPAASPLPAGLEDSAPPPSVPMTTRERIRRHSQTLTCLRRRRRRRSDEEGPAPSQVGVQASPGEARLSQSESEQEVMSSRAAGDEDDEEEQEEEEEEEQLFAEDYLLRVCDAVQVCPGVAEQLLQLLDQFSSTGGRGTLGAELLFDGLKGVLRLWPQLLRDFSAFLNRRQAQSCGLLVEQELFERSRQFLRKLGRSLGVGSSLYRQVVSVLQGGSTPSPEAMDEVSSLLRLHPQLQQEFWEFFQQLSIQPSPGVSRSATDSVSQNPPVRNRKSSDSDREEGAESGRHICAKNISVMSSGEKVVVWTREADRTILTACQQRGANQKTFRHVSAQLGNKTAQQVSLRYHDLMNLFQQAKSTSCS